MFSLRALSPLAGDGRLYRAFGQLVCAGHGYVFTTPLPTVDGQFSGLVDGSPVPWAELVMVLDEQPGIELYQADLFDNREVIKTVFSILPDCWRYKQIQMNQGGSPIALFTHQAGARLAVVEK